VVSLLQTKLSADFGDDLTLICELAKLPAEEVGARHLGAFEENFSKAGETADQGERPVQVYRQKSMRFQKDTQAARHPLALEKSNTQPEVLHREGCYHYAL